MPYDEFGNCVDKQTPEEEKRGAIVDSFLVGLLVGLFVALMISL